MGQILCVGGSAVFGAVKAGESCRIQEFLITWNLNLVDGSGRAIYRRYLARPNNMLFFMFYLCTDQPTQILGFFGEKLGLTQTLKVSVWAGQGVKCAKGQDCKNNQSLIISVLLLHLMNSFHGAFKCIKYKLDDNGLSGIKDGSAVQSSQEDSWWHRNKHKPPVSIPEPG